MKRTHTMARRLLVATPVVASLLLVACGDDDDDSSSSDASVAVEAPSPTVAPADTTAAPAGETVVVTASDYAFAGLPASVTSGTKLSLTNSSEKELHEMVIIRIPDAETRPVSELVALPQEEVDAIFGAGPPAIVQLAMPGSSEPIPALGDGTLAEPGRYAVICFIPQGIDPQEYMDAAATSGDGPPAVTGGPPHAALGMFAELTVEG